MAYQRAAKAAKATYFSNVILHNQSRPKVLFSVINSVVHPLANTMSVASVALCESFLGFLKEKVVKLGLVTHIPPIELSLPPQLSVSWDVFELVSLQSLTDTIDKLKPSFSSYDVIHPRFLKQIVDSVGPGLVSFLNKCLSTRVVPAHLKVAAVTPLLKKPSLDLSVLKKLSPYLCFTIYFQGFGKDCVFPTSICLSTFNLVLRLPTVLNLLF